MLLVLLWFVLLFRADYFKACISLPVPPFFDRVTHKTKVNNLGVVGNERF